MCLKGLLKIVCEESTPYNVRNMKKCTSCWFLKLINMLYFGLQKVGLYFCRGQSQLVNLAKCFQSLKVFY